jgi:thiol peroxidase
MAERSNVVKFKGNPLTLLGDEIAVDDSIPSVTVTNGDLKEINLTDYKGKVVILSTVLSLDTGTCDTETRRFNKEAAALGDDVSIVVVSMDLPFAQKRWCGAAGVDKVEVFSDYRDAKLGRAFGLLTKELHLLARAVFVIDKEGIVRYRELVEEASGEPDYEKAIAAAKKLI